jgi:UDP-glucose 4-epimerase
MKNKHLKVMVTGSAGFIGKHLCEALRKHEHVQAIYEFDKKDRLRYDICSDYDVGQKMLYWQPDVIFHLAAQTEVKYDLSKDTMYTNVIGTETLLKHMPRGSRFVLASSIHCGYCSSVYAASKLGAEALVKSYTNMGLIESSILRLTSVVGKNMTHGVVKSFMEQLRSDNKMLDIIGVAPGSLRPYVHISDVVDTFIYYGVDSIATFSEDNISPNNKVDIDDLADMVMYTMNIKKPKKWLGESSEWLGDVKFISIPDNRMKLPKLDSIQAITQAVKDNL